MSLSFDAARNHYHYYYWQGNHKSPNLPGQVGKATERVLTRVTLQERERLMEQEMRS
jgi:hypothetical protein